MKYILSLILMLNVGLVFCQQHFIQEVGVLNSYNSYLNFEYYANYPSPAVNNWTYFSANDSIHGPELWKTDGDTCILVKNTNTDSIGSLQKGIEPTQFINYLNDLYFLGQDTAILNNQVNVLWQSDGNDVWQVAAFDSVKVISNLLEFNGNFIFLGKDLILGTINIYSYDGVNISITPVLNYFYTGSTYLTELLGKVYFIGHDLANLPSSFQYLFEYDGTSTNIVPNGLVSELGVFSSISVFTPSAELMYEYNNELYFTGYDTIHGFELRKFDGTTVTLVSDLNPGQGHGCSVSFKTFQNKLYFQGSNGVSGWELWNYDGSAVQMVHDLGQATCGSTGTTPCSSMFMEVFGNKLYFVQDTVGVTGQLWQYDGVNSEVVKYQYPNHDDFYEVTDLKISGPYLYFRAIDSIRGYQLWRLEDCAIQNTATTELIACSPRLNNNGEPIVGEAVFVDTLTNSCGGDSVLTTHYTYYPINTAAFINNFILTAQANNMAYQWMDCNLNQNIINETSQSFTPSENGTYAVILTDQETGCSDTSDCLNVAGLNVSVLYENDIEIYPNPTKGSFIIKGVPTDIDVQLKIYNAIGQLVSFQTKSSASGFIINIEDVEAGVYFVNIENNKFRKTLKLMVVD